MKFELFNQSIVIIANNFNPSLIRESWLDDEKIIPKKELVQGCIFTEAIVQVNTNKFTLLVLPQQLQFISHNSNTSKGNTDDTLIKFIKALRHTPYTAAGANLIWHLNLNGEKLTEVTKKLFYRDNSLYKKFSNEDAHFGAYLSKDMGNNVRLKLNILPAKIQTPGKEPFETLQFSFNYHIDLKGVKPADELIEFISNWSTYFEESEKINLSLV